ncbi:putative metal-binding motif-containing protein [Archangium violaceum]|uniref:putative metal-binding motif-containing protein n=1 Tax=Archangium violaceum TaxID=83451 RepID=UPI00193AE145|nr:putative metal-binding motif-containing protein [Archangium violaceum]QRK06727.1 putative metal-binding motif-containing protein [Archangium violaceum]
MRLFLLLMGMWVMAGCRSADAGAVRVEIFYATFRPGCLTVTAVDAADPSHSETQQLTVEDRHSDSKTVAVFRKSDWSRDLRVTASAHEASCTGPEVATSTQRIQVPEKGSTVVYLDLRAEDLDGDGFVSALAPGRGTDCDDTDATVYPGAPETCDGKDSNCSGDESDATDPRGYYVDADGDGYGDATRPVVRACVAPAGRVMEAGDCDDTDATVHPGQAELLCDGRDQDCDGTADEDFLLGSACKTEFGCSGVRVCSADGFGVRCSSSESPTTWYVDTDGDGRAGSFATFYCEGPPGSKPTSDDCDDTSRFIGGSEECDRLDNDCDGSVDEDACLTQDWTARTVGGGSAWEAVTTYTTGSAWLAGAGGRLAHVSGSAVTDISACGADDDWKAAWARPSDGRVFLGSTRGKIATTTSASGAECATTSAEGMTSVITGMVGFERNGVTTVYAVTSGGHVLRWEWTDAPVTPTPPVVMEQVAAKLRSIHGQGPDSLFAVGAEDYRPDQVLPRIFRLDTDSGRWVRESLPGDVGTGSLQGVFGVGGGLAYAVGDRGLVLERHDGSWRKLPAPDDAAAPDLLDVVAFHPTVVLVLSNKGGTYLHQFDGSNWSEPAPQAQALLSLDAIAPQEQWAAGEGGTLVRWSSP